jgi:hypothetical protein
MNKLEFILNNISSIFCSCITKAKQILINDVNFTIFLQTIIYYT